MTHWADWIGAEVQDDGRALLVGQGPVRPFVAEVTSCIDADNAMQDILRRQWREKWGMNKDRVPLCRGFFMG